MRRMKPLARIFGFLALCLLMAFVITGCQPQTAPASTPTTPPLAKSITFYAWTAYMPQSVLDAFEKKYGVKVNYVFYENQETAIQELRDGKSYDVIVFDDQFIPGLKDEKLIAPLDHANIPNMKNISANFRDLAYDPGNAYAIPFHWGTTGLVVRKDLLAQPATSWNDLWDARYHNKVVVWNIPRTYIGLTLKSLGYSMNSEKPEELHKALDRMLELKPYAIIPGGDVAGSNELLADGRAVIAMGWAYDLIAGREANPNIDYVLPKEGSVLWGDNLTIPTSSPNKYTAELFINFIYEPEQSAAIIDDSYYAMPNDAALPFVNKAIASDQTIFPTNEQLRNAEITLPVSPEGEKLYDEIWRQYLAEEF